MKVQKH